MISAPGFPVYTASSDAQLPIVHGGGWLERHQCLPLFEARWLSHYANEHEKDQLLLKPLCDFVYMYVKPLPPVCVWGTHALTTNRAKIHLHTWVKNEVIAQPL